MHISGTDPSSLKVFKRQWGNGIGMFQLHLYINNGVAQWRKVGAQIFFAKSEKQKKKGPKA